MNFKTLTTLSIFFFVFLISSCLDDDTSNTFEEWKTENDTYFNNMKDSTSYTLIKIPASRGGSSYYYKIINQGDLNGGSPSFSDLVYVNYRGKLISGIVFDQTYKLSNPANDSTAKPAKFYTNALIQGWSENLMQMKTGEIRRIVIPHELAYGTRDLGIIKPYSTLVFDIQLKAFGASVPLN